ncbi:MAG: M13 family metallopeptidase [bacterium]
MKQTRKHWGFDVRGMDTNVRPQDDFFRHAHGTWLRKAKIPANESRWGTFSTLRAETDKQLKKLVERIARGRYAAGSPEQMIRDFYRSGLDEKRREKLGAAPLAPWLSRIGRVQTTEDLLSLTAEFHTLGIGVLWGGMIDQDLKNSERYALYLQQDGLGMPDRDYYLKDDAESKRVRGAYVRHIEAMHRLLGLSPKDCTTASETVMRIETMLARASMKKELARDLEKTYHKVSPSALRKIAPGIDWKRYLNSIGAACSGDLIVTQPGFLKAVNGMLKTVPLADWKVYFRWHLINDFAGALSRAFVRQQFAFYGKTLMGSKQLKPLWRRSLAATSGSLGELLGQAYVKEHFTSEAKLRMNGLVDDLFAAYEKRIKYLDWMTPDTKKKAVRKLSQMNRKIGYPDKWRSYRGLVVRTDDYFGNLVRSAKFEHRREMKKLGRPIDRSEWGMYPQTVNAYCNFNMNEIVFPAGILQPPFFDLSADDAINYGCIGAVIGHEITHGFDDQGSKFDGKGNMRAWWSKEDRKRFMKKAKLVEKQFDQYRVADGVPVNGKLTLGENIADLGGASIAFDAYQAALSRTGKREAIQGFTPEQRFFLGFALFEREVVRPEFVKMQVLTDPHSPGEFRINGPVSNLPEFYEAFGVRKGDKLYREPKERARIW